MKGRLDDDSRALSQLVASSAMASAHDHGRHLARVRIEVAPMKPLGERIEMLLVLANDASARGEHAMAAVYMELMHLEQATDAPFASWMFEPEEIRH
jgi:hypothetical protein